MLTARWIGVDRVTRVGDLTGTCQPFWVLLVELRLVSGIETESQSQPFLAYAPLPFPRQILQETEGRREIHCPNFPHLNPSGLGLANLNPAIFRHLRAHQFLPTPRSSPTLPFRTPALRTMDGEPGPDGLPPPPPHALPFDFRPSIHLYFPVRFRLSLSLLSKQFPSLRCHSKPRSMSPSTLLLAYTPQCVSTCSVSVSVR